MSPVGAHPTGAGAPTSASGRRSALLVPLSELRRHTSNRRPWQAEVGLEGLAVTDARVDPGDPVRLDLVIESVPDGAVVTGAIGIIWRGQCQRCLRDVVADHRFELREVYAVEAVDGESYPLGREDLDLEPMVRDAVLLELPLRPVCPDDGDGPCQVEGYVPDAPEEEGVAETAEDRLGDPRWAVLDQLRDDV